MNLKPGSETGFGAHPRIVPGSDFETLQASLRKGRNDMEDAACVLAPIVSDVLAVLAAAPGCRLARMSGSGATCFALFNDCRGVARAKKIDPGRASAMVGEGDNLELNPEKRRCFSGSDQARVPSASSVLSAVTRYFQIKVEQSREMPASTEAKTASGHHCPLKFSAIIVPTSGVRPPAMAPQN